MSRSTFPRATPPDFGRAFGISSVGTTAGRDTGKAFRLLRLSALGFDGIRLLIIPWSQVRVLAGPPSPLEFIALCRRERELESLGVTHRVGRRRAVSPCNHQAPHIESPRYTRLGGGHCISAWALNIGGCSESGSVNLSGPSCSQGLYEKFRIYGLGETIINVSAGMFMIIRLSIASQRDDFHRPCRLARS